MLDDDPDMLDLISSWLSDLGFRVESFSRFDKFLNALSHQAVDLIVLDLQMPDIDGIEALEKLATHKVESPVILLSAMADDLIYNTRVLANYYGVNVIAALNKQISFRDFSDTITMSIVDMPECTPAINSAELQFVYQPIMSLQTGRVQGIEALVRINGRPPKPDQIKALELGDQSVELWHATVEQTFSDWKRFGDKELSLSINVSAGLLICKGFRENLVARCKAYGLPVTNLTLELTERSFVSRPLDTFRGMCQLRLLGVRLALDDFGKRFSTIERLRTLPFTDVKFDQELLRKDLKSALTLQRAVYLAEGLGFRATSEAVETQEQCDTVKSLKIELAQGYLFSKPMSVERLEEAGLFARSDSCASIHDYLPA